MSKKLLALLIAVSTCCAFGCSDDDDSDSCKTGEKRCDGNMTQTCVNGNWSKGTPCTDGCDKATGVCTVPKDPCTTAGEKRCSGKQLQECKDGNWSKLEDCKDSCDEAKKECVEPIEPPTGNECAPGVTNKDCTPACSADKATGYFWNSKTDAIGSKTCPKKDCYIDGTSVKCKEVEKCDKNTAKKTCVDANTVSFCNNNGEMQTKTCNSCTLNADSTYYCCDGNNSKCDGGDIPKCTGEKVQTGGEEGTCCDAANYQVSCINENANALICAQGAVKKWTCKDNICSVGSDNKVKCDNPNGTGGGSDKGDTDNLEDCTATSNAKCKAACAADGKGYYWNSKNVVTQDCPAKQLNCLNNNGKIVCIGDVTEETCDPSAKPAPTCTGGNAKVKYCDSNVNKFVVKPCATCVVKEGVYYCDGDDKLTDCTTLDSTDKCKGVCTSETEGLRFSSREGKVVKWTCSKPGEKCEADATGWLSCKK